MEQSRSVKILKIISPLILGGAILYWMYRDFDFQQVRHVVFEEMSWTWMLLSFPFGILAQMMRGWRWKQTLEPIVSRNEGDSRNEDSSRNEGDSRNEEGGTRNEDSSRCEVRGTRCEDRPILK